MPYIDSAKRKKNENTQYLHAWKCIHRIRDGVLIRDVCMRVCLLQLNYFLLNGFTQPIKYERKEFGVCVRGGAPDEHRRRISFHFFFLFSFTSSSLFRLRYAKLEKAFQMEMLLEANRTEPNRHIHPYISNMPQFPAECLILEKLGFCFVFHIFTRNCVGISHFHLLRMLAHHHHHFHFNKMFNEQFTLRL